MANDDSTVRPDSTSDDAVSGGQVSVVIAAYGQLEYLPETLAAIDGQTAPPFEVVIVDDASPYDVPAAISRSSISVPLRYVRREVNGGVAAARNAGNDAAAGDWIAVCDSDDVWMPDKLEKQLRLINTWSGEEPLVAVGASAMNVNQLGRPFGVLAGGSDTKDAYLARLANDRPFVMCHSSVLYRRDAALRCGGYPTDTTPMTVDTELLTNLAKEGLILTVPEVLVNFRKHGASQSMSWTSVRAQHVSLLRIEENLRRQRLGQRPLEPEEFIRIRAVRGRGEKLKEIKLMAGRFLYRSGAVQIANGKSLAGAIRLALALPLVPRLVSSGVRGKLRLGRGGASSAR